MANAFLELLNTPIGIFATQIALLGAAFWGGTGLIKAMGVIPNLFSQFATAAGGAATATTVASGAVTGFGVALKTALPIIGAVILAVQAAIAIWDAFTVSNQELQESIDTTKTKISELKTEMDTLQSKEDLTTADEARLAVLEKQIEAQERLLQQQYELQYSRNFGNDAAGNESSKYTNLYSNIEEYNKLTEEIEKNEQTILRWNDSSADMSRQITVLGERNEELKDRQAELGQSITETYGELETFADELNNVPDEVREAMETVEEWAKANQTAEDTADNLAESSDNLADSVSDTGDTIEQSTEQAKTAIDQLSELDEAYGTLMDAVDEYNSTGQFTISTLESLLNLDDSYRDMLVEEDGQLKINTKSLQDKKDALVKAYTEERIAALSAELYEIAMNRANSELDNSKTALANSETKVNTWSTAVANAVNSAISLTDAVMGLDTALGADPNWLGLTEEQEAASKAAIERAREDLEMFQRFSLSTGSRSSGGSGSGGSSSTKKETDPIEEQSKIFEEQNKQIEWNIKMRERQGASEEELIELQKQLQDQLHEQAEWYRGEGLTETSSYLQETIDAWWEAKDAIDGYNEDIKQNNRDALDKMIDDTEQYIDDRTEFANMGAEEEYQIWLQLIDDIDDLYSQGLVDYEYYLEKRQDATREALRAQQRAEKEAQEAAEEARQAEIDEIERQIDVYETLFDVVARKAQEEIDALNARRDAVEKYYDDQIAALQKTNEELDKEIQKETLLDNLARARQSQVMVYQDGKWQYVQNIDEISEAQAELEAFERDQALQQEVDNLNRLKEQALASIDEQIQGWEEYKEQWASVVEDYQAKQDELLVAQELGIELEGENWELRLENMESYVSQYLAYAQRLIDAQNAINAALGTGGSSLSISSGGGGGGGGGGGSGAQWDRVSQGKKSVDKWIASGGDISDWIVGNNGYVDPDVLKYANEKRNEKIDKEGLDEEKYDNVTDLINDKDPDRNGNIDKTKKYAGGTTYADPGISLVGEDGPELRVLNRGDGILPSDITKNLWKWGELTPEQMINNVAVNGLTGNTSTSTINIDKIILPEVKDGPGFIEYMKNNIGTRSAQLAFSRR